MRSSVLRVLLACILISNVAHAVDKNGEPTYVREITVSEMFNEIKNCKEEKGYLLKNARIIPDKFLFDDTLVIDIPIQISGCLYDHTRLINLWNITFKQRFDIYKTEDLGIFFQNCVFEKDHAWRFDHVPNAVYDDCTFNGTFVFFNNTGGLYFKNCVFDHQREPGAERLQLEIYPWNKTQKQLTIYGTQFSSEDDSSFIYISGSIDKVGFYQSTFGSVTELSGLSADRHMIIQQCEFKRPVGFEETVFNVAQTDIKFSQLEGFKIALYPYGVDSTTYLANGDVQLTDTIQDNPYLFNSLVSVYSKLFNTYKYRGDRESANACYVEMKDIETRQLKYRYEQDPSFTNYLNHQLNCFLKYFADYGTSPVRSLSVSVKVILLFSLIYFFFYSDWDRIDRSFLMRRFRGLMNYLRQDRSMEEVYYADHEDERQNFETFRKEIEENRIHLPFFIRLSARPLYQLSLVRHHVIRWFYRKAEIRQRKWAELSRLRRWAVGSTVAFAMVGYGMWLVAIRSLNSVVLSINAFSTLGFGDIPVRGLSRYMAILEGFIGWFLLSIFSVSLISQILQN